MASGRSAARSSSTPPRSGSTSSGSESALDGGVHRAAIEADVKLAEGAGLGATPGFAIAAATAQADPRSGLIEAYRVSGALPLSRFKRVVRQALREAR